MKKYLSILALICLSASVFAKTDAVLTVVPNLTKLNLQPTDSATISYTVTNTTRSTVLTELSIFPASGGGHLPSLTLKNDTCTGSTLAVQASCTFDLLVSGKDQLPNFQISPSVCAFKNSAVCSQPTSKNRVQVIVKQLASLGTAYIARVAGNDPTTSNILPIDVASGKLGTPLTDVSFFLNEILFPSAIVSKDRKTLYVTNNSQTTSLANSVSIYDISGTPTIKAIISLGGLPPTGLAVLPDNSKIYVGTFGAILVYDQSYTLVNTIGIPSDINVALSLSTDGSLLYAWNDASDTNSLLVIETDNDTVNSLGLPAFQSFGTALANPSNSNLYFTAGLTTNGQSNPINLIAALDINHSYTLINAIDTTQAIDPPQAGPLAMAFTPNGKQLYVGMAFSSSVVVFDATTPDFNILQIIPVDGAPVGVAFDPTGSVAYVSTFETNSVTVIKTADYSTTTINIDPENQGFTPLNYFGFFIG